MKFFRCQGFSLYYLDITNGSKSSQYLAYLVQNVSVH